jgi:hypothetical protein
VPVFAVSALVLLLASSVLTGGSVVELMVRVLGEPTIIPPSGAQVGIPETEETLTFRGLVTEVISGDSLADGSRVTVRIGYYTQPASEQVRNLLSQIRNGTVLRILGSMQDGILAVNLGNAPDPERWVTVISPTASGVAEFSRSPSGILSLLSAVVLATLILMLPRKWRS